MAVSLLCSVELFRNALQILVAFYVVSICSCIESSTSLSCNGQTERTIFNFSSGLSNTRGLQIDSQGHVFVSAGNMLYSLSSSLTKEGSTHLSADAVNRGVTLRDNGQQVVVCLKDLSCVVYNATNLSAGSLKNASRAISSLQSGVSLFGAGKTFYVGSIREGAMLLEQHGEGFVRSSRNSLEQFNITRSNRLLFSSSGFVRNGSAYLFTVDNDSRDIGRFRIIRVCHVTSCPTGNKSCGFSAMYEADFLCNGPTSSDTHICDVSILNSVETLALSGTVAIITRCETSSPRNSVCSLNLSAIDEMMDNKFTSCSSADLNSTEDVGISWERKYLCNQVFRGEDTDKCRFFPPIGVSLSNSAPIIVNLAGNIITSSVAIRIESFYLIFVAYQNGGNFTVAGYNLEDLHTIINEYFCIRHYDSKIHQLSWLTGSNYVVAVTTESVMEIPIEECSSHTDCVSCSADRNPLCGWCVVENKCSRQSQCLDVNNTSTMRWVQDGGECLVVKVSPDKFLIDSTEKLSVSVSYPGLPILLPTHNYSCYLADHKGRFVFNVTAVEVIPGIEYTCDIQESIPFFRGFFAKINLTLVSSLFEIQFGTIFNIYNCNGTTSCVECLKETSGYCGWCKLNSLCSSSNLPCQNGSLLQLSGNAVEEVCPLIEQFPANLSRLHLDFYQLPANFTPSAFVVQQLPQNIIQPAFAAQNITLRTRNMPRPVDGYQYNCIVNNIHLQTAYENDTSLTCIVKSGNLTLESDPYWTQISFVTVSVIWTGNGIVNTVDNSLGEENNVLLYTCPGTKRCINCNQRYDVFTCGWCDSDGEQFCGVEAQCPDSFKRPGTDCATYNLLGVLIGPPLVTGVLLFIVAPITAIICICCRNLRKLRLALHKSEVANVRINEELSLAVPSISHIRNLMTSIPESFKIPSSHLKLSSISIGQGEFGVVYKAKLMDWNGKSSQLVAVKTLKGLFSASDIEGMISEIIKMKELHHPHVMSLIGVCLDAGPGVSIVMPYMACGSLLDYLKKERDSIDLNEDSDVEQILVVRKLLLRMSHQIALGMEFLAHQKLIHRDLAARNCMINRSGDVKVGDFGLAEDIYSTGYFRQEDRENVKLPFKWMAPESLEDAVFTEKTDVWSYGVTLWEIFSSGRTPYPALNPSSLISLLKQGERMKRPENAACATEIFSIMRKCWREAPDDRPHFAELSSITGDLLTSISYTELGMDLMENANEGYEEIMLPEINGNDGPGEVRFSQLVVSEGVNILDNVAYSTSDGVNILDNVAYSTSDGVNILDNVAYGTSDEVKVP